MQGRTIDSENDRIDRSSHHVDTEDRSRVCREAFEPNKSRRNRESNIDELDLSCVLASACEAILTSEMDGPMGVLVTAVVLPSRRKADPFVVVRSYVNWSNALQEGVSLASLQPRERTHRCSV